jgi:hypothetical protein
MSIQRSACSVHSFRCMRRKAFWAPGRAIAFSALRARSSALTEIPKLGFALRQTCGSVQSSPSSADAMKANQLSSCSTPSRIFVA